MKRIKLTVAYDGTNYHGWQAQPNGITIEEVLNQKLTELLKEPITVIGASRTDAGVHALGNVAVFDTDARIPPEKVSYALNQRLPEDIVIQDSREASPDFHPRRCASRKIYEYKILNRTFPQPLRRHDTLFYYYKINEADMQKAADYLIGTHDFRKFLFGSHTGGHNHTHYLQSDCYEEQDILTMRVCGSGFLYNMVRILAGTLLQVGTGELRPDQMPEILSACDRAQAGPTAPAHGLTLVGIAFAP